MEMLDEATEQLMSNQRMKRSLILPLSKEGRRKSLERGEVFDPADKKKTQIRVKLVQTLSEERASNLQALWLLCPRRRTYKKAKSGLKMIIILLSSYNLLYYLHDNT